MKGVNHTKNMQPGYAPGYAPTTNTESNNRDKRQRDRERERKKEKEREIFTETSKDMHVMDHGLWKANEKRISSATKRV